MSAHSDFRNLEGPGPLPNGLYVREERAIADASLMEDGTGGGRSRRWYITGRNPEFWWDIVITRLPSDIWSYELHCTRCGLSDQAASMDDVLRLIRAGAHFHDTDPAGDA